MKCMRVTMPDGSQYDVPVDAIAKNRAEHYKDEFDGDLKRSLDEDTNPLFKSDDYEIEDWAQNNMNWSDVESVAIKYHDGDTDYDEGWVNGEKEIVERE